MTLTFENEQDGILLRDFLRRCSVSASLSAAVKRTGGFFADGRPIRADQRLAAGQQVSFALPPDPPSTVAPQDLPLHILYEDAHIMAIDKPAGITVHPTRGYADGTLANAFMGLMARRGIYRAFRPINRLDREASGLVLCAMNAWAAPLLSKSAQKTYLALAQGQMEVEQGAFTWPIGLANGSLIRRECRADGQPSCTQYRVLRTSPQASLARCVTVTGRTHQIRVHFAFAGHPLLGDDLYGGSRAFIGRTALHCWRVDLVHPQTGQPMHLTCPVADDIKELLFHIFRV